MASFTDSPELLTRFNPYVQQVPTEAHVSVGVELQRRYDEGVQKIQSSIDRVAGLDIARDVDKKYLQSKLNELGTRLRTVAAGDFSNYQLTNHVAGMASSVGKDENVINAVTSTARYKKGLSEMQAAIRDGKSSPSNEWDFKSKANDWLSSTDITKGFNDDYLPYTDYKKHSLEVIKALTKDENITDDAFTVDEKGNLVITDAVVRHKLAGISPEKIQQALMVSLNPADMRQMAIDGRYNYSNVPADIFTKNIKSDYQSRKDALIEKRKVLDNAKTSTKSADVKSQLDAKIGEIDKSLSSIDKQYSSILERISSGKEEDIESAKATLHTINFMNGFSSAFAFTETSQTYENSPLADMAMKREVKEQDWKKFVLDYNQRDAHFQANLLMKQKDQEIEERKLALEEKGTGGFGGFPGEVDKSDIPSVTLENVIASTEAGKNQIDNLDQQLIQRMGKDQDWLNQQYKAWSESPSSVDPELAHHFSKTSELRRLNESNADMIQDIRDEVSRRYEDIYAHIPADAKGLSISTRQGNLQFSPREIVDFNSKIARYRKVSPPKGEFETTTEYEYDAKSLEGLNDKEKYLYSLYKKLDESPMSMTKEELAVINHLDGIRKSVNEPYKATINQIDKEIAEEVNNRVTSYQGVYYGLTPANPAQKSQLISMLSSAVNIAEKSKGMAESPDFDIKVLRKLALDPGAATLKVVEGTEFQPSMYEVTVSGEAGSTKFRITPEQKSSIFGDTFEASPSINHIRKYQEQIRKKGGYTTAIDGKSTTESNGFLNSTDFTGVKTFGISGNLVDIDGRYLFRLNLYDPIKQKWVSDIPYPSNLMSAEQVATAMTKLTDVHVYELLYGKPATAADLEEMKKLPKNPLR